MAVVAIGLAGASCGSNNSPGGGSLVGPDGGSADSGHPGLSNPPLMMPAVALGGGPAPSAGGQGQAGGLAHLVSGGGITIGPDFQAPAMPAGQSAPGGTMSLAASSLGADVSAAGSIAITGDVASGGSDSVRQIVAAGDIFVDGTLRGADLGGARQGLSLRASGTVYVSGNLDTSGAAGGGQAGGSLTIMAHQVIVSGKLTTAGGSGVSGGAAGALTISTTAGAYFGGTIDASGGDGQGAQNVSGGRGGDLSLQAAGDVLFAGSAAFHGGGRERAARDDRHDRAAGAQGRRRPGRGWRGRHGSARAPRRRPAGQRPGRHQRW
jgi:hypothetical protein